MFIEPMYFRAFVAQELINWYYSENPFPYDHLLVQFLHKTDNHKFLYCARNPERVAFNFLFWTSPFDTWSWIYLGTSILLLGGSLRGKCLEVIGILLRQSCTILNTKKILILLMFVTIVLTCGYESIISSHITVPPPYSIAANLKTLVERGYRIIKLDEFSENKELSEIFVFENITSRSLKSSLVPNTSAMNLFQLRQHVFNCNATIGFKYCTSNLVLAPYWNATKCFCARNSEYTRPMIFTFSGYDRYRFAHAAQVLTESGIIQMYKEIYPYIHGFRNNWILRITEIGQNGPIAFKLSDWKIGSIFLIWITVAGFGFISFVIEIIISKCISVFLKINGALDFVLKSGLR